MASDFGDLSEDDEAVISKVGAESSSFFFTESLEAMAEYDLNVEM